MTDMDIKFELLAAKKEVTRLRNRVEKQDALLLRWNKAASRAGMAGSEFHDDPERVFERVNSHCDSLRAVLLRREVTI